MTEVVKYFPMEEISRIKQSKKEKKALTVQRFKKRGMTFEFASQKDRDYWASALNVVLHNFHKNNLQTGHEAITGQQTSNNSNGDTATAAELFDWVRDGEEEPEALFKIVEHRKTDLLEQQNSLRQGIPDDTKLTVGKTKKRARTGGPQPISSQMSHSVDLDKIKVDTASLRSDFSNSLPTFEPFGNRSRSTTLGQLPSVASTELWESNPFAPVPNNQPANDDFDEEFAQLRNYPPAQRKPNYQEISLITSLNSPIEGHVVEDFGVITGIGRAQDINQSLELAQKQLIQKAQRLGANAILSLSISHSFEPYKPHFVTVIGCGSACAISSP
eukprot:CAMPEP_0174256430 /NCGR_PEP_ID=MMETSP0439-20130205/5660_1 /TAXON_ID=0 /ORGANISM="Stereomyxa ramosa, Strain Chinc5" /LENGTH=329 /DNA_ID=CAMNT_0015339025 /DNA_START=237 /DNA_END=1226 /DNA_ORIENTATION=+